MKKELKDYLHLYLGCEILMINSPETTYTLNSYWLDWFNEHKEEYDNHKLILRPLSDMTEVIEHKGEKFIPLKVLAGWAGTCSPDDWVIKDKYTVEHAKVKGCTFKITDSGDLIMKRSEKWKDFEVCSQQVKMFHNMLEWHFDLFGLIPAGLAIDSTTLKNTHQ